MKLVFLSEVFLVIYQCFPVFDLQNNKNEWVKILEDTEIVVDELLEKQKASDPDLWVVEVESANGQNYLDEFY